MNNRLRFLPDGCADVRVVENFRADMSAHRGQKLLPRFVAYFWFVSHPMRTPGESLLLELSLRKRRVLIPIIVRHRMLA